MIGHSNHIFKKANAHQIMIANNLKNKENFNLNQYLCLKCNYIKFKKIFSKFIFEINFCFLELSLRTFLLYFDLLLDKHQLELLFLFFTILEFAKICSKNLLVKFT